MSDPSSSSSMQHQRLLDIGKNSPSSNATSLSSQSHSVDYLATDLQPELESDISQVKPCEFDDLLQYFLYLSLDSASEVKKRLDEDQSEIEAIEADMMDPDCPKDKVALQQTLDEKTQHRNGILEEILDRLLEGVLPVCKDQALIEHLTYYCEKTSQETDRYAPYVMASNRALDVMNANKDLEKLGEELSFRYPSPLDLRFHRNDPKVLQSKYPGTATSVKRKPDVIATSRVAAEDHGSDNMGVFGEPEYTKPPQQSFKWPHVLSCHEFKWKLKRLHDHDKPLGVYTTKRQHSYIHIDPQVTDVYDADPVEIPITISGTGRGMSKKRNLNSEQAVGSASKKTKLTPSDGSSSKFQSVPAALPTFTDSHDVKKNKNDQKLSARAQCAMYALEMLSDTVGMHHAINVLIVDAKLWVFYFDRQGVLQSNGIHFIRDLPRFLVLLFAFQRFHLEDWGVIPRLNPTALLYHNSTPQEPPQSTQSGDTELRRSSRKIVAAPAPEDVLKKSRKLRSVAPQECTLDVTVGFEETFEDKKLHVQEISIKVGGDGSTHKPHCLAGRATTVIDATIIQRDTEDNRDVICKIYHPEVQRQDEGDIIRRIYQKTDEDKSGLNMRRHLPTMLYCGDLKGYLTNRVRSFLGLCWKGHRTIRLILFVKLKPLSSVIPGNKFVKAWLDTVKCHAYLWKLGIEHGDPSLWNLLYDPHTECGVLSDYDLSILQGEKRVFGNQRTGTIPFMAVELLRKQYFDGQVKRQYYHELEAFIWVLAYAFMQYLDGSVVNVPGSPASAWKTANYIECGKDKESFWNGHRLTSLIATHIQTTFVDQWQLMYHLLEWARDEDRNRAAAHRRSKPPPLPGLLMRRGPLPTAITQMGEVFASFIGVLKATVDQSPQLLGYLAEIINDLDKVSELEEWKCIDNRNQSK